jgi:hypothetical protein
LLRHFDLLQSIEFKDRFSHAENVLGLHRDVAICLEKFASLLRNTGPSGGNNASRI